MIMSKSMKKSYCEKEQAGGMLKKKKREGKVIETMGGISYSGEGSEKISRIPITCLEDQILFSRMALEILDKIEGK